MRERIEIWLAAFGLEEGLHQETVTVVERLPDAVRDDLMEDRGFMMSDYEPARGLAVCVPLGLPGLNRASRSVVLKRTLRHRPVEFVRYVIAHELAHAHLRNDGRTPEEDPEDAADALAAEWGFPRPFRW